VTNPEAQQQARQPVPEAEPQTESQERSHTRADGRSAESSEAAAGVPSDAGTDAEADAHAAAGSHAAAEATARLERAVLAAEQALIEFEIAVDTFRIELENFSRLHHQRLGPMYSRLDELDALIAEAVAARTGDPEDIRKAREARGLVLPMPKVEELFHGWIDSDGLSPEGAAMLTEQPVQPPPRVRPSEEARRIYRELARNAHPDLAEEAAERERRGEFIVRVNAAYAAGDEERLRALAEEWAAGPPPPERRWSRSEELYARLEWLAERKEMLAQVAAELESSAIGAMIKMAPEDPDGLLDEIAEQLLAKVAEKENQLSELVR
jgi:hypothetical protein